MGTGKKRGRSSAVAGCSSRAANGGRSSQKRKQEEEEDFAEDYEETHVDSMNKYEDVRDWEDLVASVDTIERGREDVLMIYLTMTGGEKVAQPADVVYRRCPQKVLKFYEAHLKWRLTV
ncbi:hypothetical protein BD324DRAFT_345905 [Kockovaella imperatae]|uniref:Chromo shadow domain-containing protein n=1 Tax=Kockovaella imperatae TaxID=4999 RepID=A0A1Y1UJV3_9TREE|nr:hypothetical protein BD324DRAFT_345905 [Kockovaella imperatae]ORX38262.1 hypothetical protein BD324DRAFT_345905 [Kockovaella imperatae]